MGAREVSVITAGVSLRELLERPVMLGDIRLGAPIDAVLDADSLRVVGLEVECGDGLRRFLPLAAARIRDDRLSVERATLVQVASPSRERVETYRQLRDEIELAVGRLNGDYSTLEHQAIAYLHHGYPREEMVALYLAADVMLVTALRDGMNLVAKEYVACRFDDDGVLLLSEFTGASDELRQAVLVNPHDLDGVKAAVSRALEMPPDEARRRMKTLRRHVKRHDVDQWAHEFLDALGMPT